MLSPARSLALPLPPELALSSPPAASALLLCADTPTPQTTDGMGGKEGKAHIKPTDSQNEEEAKKGKAAGGTYRDH